MFLMEDKDLSCIVKTLGADDLVTQAARATAAMVLTWFIHNIPFSAPEGLSMDGHTF